MSSNLLNPNFHIILTHFLERGAHHSLEGCYWGEKLAALGKIVLMHNVSHKVPLFLWPMFPWWCMEIFLGGSTTFELILLEWRGMRLSCLNTVD